VVGWLALIGSMIVWLALVGRQLRLARTKGKVWSRNGYITCAGNPAMFEACVAFYWIALVWGAAILIGIVISAFNQISN
jgi:hypothetical protein